MYDPDVVDEFIRTLPELRRADEEADGRAPAFAAIPIIEDVAAAPSLTAADETDRTLAKLRASGPDLAERIRRVVPGVEVCLFGVDAETGRLVLAHATPRVRAVAAAADLRVGDGLSGWVAANCSTIANSDPSLDFGDRARELELRSCLSIPVFGVGSVAGVLSVYDARAEAFSGNDVRVLESFAQESIAHDFNNILTAVIGNLQFATLGADFNDETAEALAAAERACGRATGLAKQLQMFSKGSAPAKAALSLPELIRDCTQFALRGSDVACEFLIADDLWQADMDSAELSRVVHNLVINAKQATPPGGTIRVQCSNVSHAPSNARALPLPPGPYVALSITDEGVGMPAEHLATIFDPRSVRADTGSRPNLAPSHSIVSAHGGHVAVSSTVGHGTRFVVHLPASLEPAVQPATTTAATLGTTTGRRVLVVDDEEEIRKVAVRLLKRLGYAPDAVSDGGMALTRYADAQRDGRPFDIVLLDLAIPGGMGALETIEQLRRIDPGVKAIVSSGYSDSTAMVDFDRFGFEGVIAKPYALAEFKATFGRLADMPVSNGQVMAFSSALRPASTATASLAG
jgi:signal transduction histidine kinase/CheY-like chemotaxis protein